MSLKLNLLQTQIANAIISLKDKSKFTESTLCKRLREISKITQKQKAHIALSDIEKALEYVKEEHNIIFSIIVTSTNELLFEHSTEVKTLNTESKQRRQKSEKSMTLFTVSDLNQKNKSKIKHTERSKRSALNIYDNLDEWEE